MNNRLRHFAASIASFTCIASSWAGYDDGVAACERGNYAAAFREFKPLAEEGLAQAQFNLGNLYRKGDGVAQDPAEAARWFRKAAEQGLAEAEFNLGVIYVIGTGVARDPAEATRWFRKAAEQGLARAQFSLGSVTNHITPKQRTIRADCWIIRCFFPDFSALEVNCRCTGPSIP